MFRLALVTILSFHSILLFASETVQCRSKEGLRKRSAHAAYWYVDDQTDSFIEVKNLLDSPLILLPKLTDISGKSLELKPVRVAAQSTVRVNLKPYITVNSKGRFKSRDGKAVERWGDGSRANSQLGSATLIAIWPEKADGQSFSAWIVVDNRSEGLGFVSPFHQAHADKMDAVLDGLWWLPYRDTQAYFALQNASGKPIDVQMQLYSRGQTIKTKRIQLDAFAFKLLNIREELGVEKPADIGGVRFSYKSRAGHHVLIARGLLVQEKRGFCSPLNLYQSIRDVPTDDPSELQAPVAYFGKIGKLVSGPTDILHPHLLLRNTSEREITVHVTLYGKDARGRHTTFQLKPVTLKPELPVRIDLEEKRQASKSDLADGVAGLSLTHDGAPTDIVAELINVSETGALVFYDRMRNLFSHVAEEQVAISFNLENRTQSFLILKNTTDRPRRVRILLDYARGKSPYELLIHIPPQQVEIVDIKHLRDTGAPDQRGQTLPRDVSFGGARIFSEPGAIVGSDPSFYVDALGNLWFSISCMWIPTTPPGGGGGGGGGTPPLRCSVEATRDDVRGRFKVKGTTAAGASVSLHVHEENCHPVNA
ncbi:MAG: hypothetical protein IID44_13745, partial [Planctomycetes bacterium]|nr:hypothetical protein [Planctomycetota bacterium]